jgi:hypothetical protein
MLLKLSKLLAVALGAFLVLVALVVVRFATLVRGTQEQTGLTAVNVYVLVHSTWLILSFIAVLVFAGWISYRWIFTTR